MHVDDPNNLNGRKFNDILSIFGLHNHVNLITHLHSHSLDLIVSIISFRQIDKISIVIFKNNLHTTPLFKKNLETLHINELAVLYDNSIREIDD